MVVEVVLVVVVVVDTSSGRSYSCSENSLCNPQYSGLKLITFRRIAFFDQYSAIVRVSIFAISESLVCLFQLITHGPISKRRCLDSNDVPVSAESGQPSGGLGLAED